MSKPKVRIYHNPRCRKSRQTLALLQERELELEIVEYLQTPPTPAELDELCRGLAKPPEQLLRRKEKRLAELGISPEGDQPRQAWLDIMSQNPILIERPIVTCRGKVALGRPPEDVLSIL